MFLPSIAILIGVACLVAAVYLGRPALRVYDGDIDDIVEIRGTSGAVEVRGEAAPVDGIIRAPITETECLAYEYEVEEYRSTGKSSSWQTVDEGQAAAPFRLADDTARVLVDARGADVVLDREETVRVDGGDEEPPEVKQFLERHADLDSQNRSYDLGIVELAAGNDRKYHERRLHAGDDAYVLGQTIYDVDARESMQDISAVVTGGPETPAFVVSDAGERHVAWELAKRPLLVGSVGLIALALGLLGLLPELYALL